MKVGIFMKAWIITVNAKIFAGLNICGFSFMKFSQEYFHSALVPWPEVLNI